MHKIQHKERKIITISPGDEVYTELGSLQHQKKWEGVNKGKNEVNGANKEWKAKQRGGEKKEHRQQPKTHLCVLLCAAHSMVR